LEIFTSPFQDYDAKDLTDFEETILRGVGYDSEGKIARKELTMILLALASRQPQEEEH
jgi:calretinin